MKIRVSPLEKPYFFEILDKKKVDYIKQEFTIWYCNLCNKIHLEKPKECSEPVCDSTDFTHISLGDIVGEKYNYIIERKRKTDLISSLRENRLYTQLKNMSEVFGSCAALVFEGNFKDVIAEQIALKKALARQGKNIGNVKSMIAQLYSIPATCMQYGISFIQVTDTQELIKMLKYFDYKCGTTPKIRERRKPIHAMLPNIVKQCLSVDGIGMTYALRIAEKYKNVIDLCIDLSNNTLIPIKGVGPARIEILKQTFLE